MWNSTLGAYSEAHLIFWVEIICLKVYMLSICSNSLGALQRVKANNTLNLIQLIYLQYGNREHLLTVHLCKGDWFDQFATPCRVEVITYFAASEWLYNYNHSQGIHVKIFTMPPYIIILFSQPTYLMVHLNHIHIPSSASADLAVGSNHIAQPNLTRTLSLYPLQKPGQRITKSLCYSH